MRREAFRNFLMRDYVGRDGVPLPEPSAGSYCTYASQAEVHLGYDLDRMNPMEPGLVTALSAVRAAGATRRTPTSTLKKIQVGVRIYAEFLRHETAQGSPRAAAR